MADTMSDFESRLRGMTEESRKFGETIHKSGLSVTKLFSTIASSHHVMEIWHTAVKRSDFLTGVNSVFSVATKTTAELTQQQRVLSGAVNRLNAFIARGIDSRRRTVAQAGDELRIKEAQLLVAQRQLSLDTELRKIHVIEGAWYATILASVTSLWSHHKQINRELIEANSSFETRYGLTKTILDTQIQLGSAYHDTVDAAQALVGYGYDMGNTLGDQLKLVVQMKDGMGVAVRTSAELVAVYDRRLKTSVRDVADSIARVANDTGLAADEATRMAISIGRAVSMLRPGLSKDLAGVNELVGRYEGALHELGGNAGAFKDLLTRMSTPEGMMQAGILGVNSPEFLASKEATRRVIDQFAQYARQTLGTSQGWDRALRLQTLSEQFGTTAQNINDMVAAADRMNKQQKSTITLQQRYEEQISNTGQALSRLGHSLQALFQQAVMPLLKVITPVINGVAKIAGGLLKIPGAVYVITGAMILSIPLIVKRVFSLTEAFILAAAAAKRLTNRLREQALASALPARGRMLPGGGGLTDFIRKMRLPARARLLRMNLRPLVNFFTTSIPQMLRSLGGMLVRSISIGSIISGGALTALAVTLWKTTKALIENYKDKTAFNGVVMLESLEQRLIHNMGKNALAGDIHHARKYVNLLREYEIQKGLDPTSADAFVARRYENLVTQVGKLRFAKETANMMVTDDAGQKRIDELVELQKLVLSESERLSETAIKNVDVNKENNRIEREKADEQKRERRIMRPPMTLAPTEYRYGRL